MPEWIRASEHAFRTLRSKEAKKVYLLLFAYFFPLIVFQTKNVQLKQQGKNAIIFFVVFLYFVNRRWFSFIFRCLTQFRRDQNKIFLVFFVKLFQFNESFTFLRAKNDELWAVRNSIGKSLFRFEQSTDYLAIFNNNFSYSKPNQNSCAAQKYLISN